MDLTVAKDYLGAMPHDISLPELRANLARKGIHQKKLAKLFGRTPQMFSLYLLGRHTPPENMRQRIELFLNLPDGTLKATAEEIEAQASSPRKP